MTYNYKVIIVKPDLLEKVCNNQGSAGYKLFHVQALQEVKPGLTPQFPIVIITYQCIYEKEIFENSDQ